jgi:hypothetical protein
MNNAVFWDITPSGSLLRSGRRLLITASVVPNSSINVNFMVQVLGSSETSVLIRPTGATSQKTVFFIVTAVKA